jgi:hypothetical protein
VKYGVKFFKITTCSSKFYANSKDTAQNIFYFGFFMKLQQVCTVQFYYSIGGDSTMYGQKAFSYVFIFHELKCSHRGNKKKLYFSYAVLIIVLPYNYFIMKYVQ